MIKGFLISDSSGYPFYSKKMNDSAESIDSTLLSGLISAIGAIGKKLFEEEVATISYGDNNKFGITIISKEIFGAQKTIYFVFLLEGETEVKKLRQLCTNIFIETKYVLKNPQDSRLDIVKKVDRLLETKYDLQTL